MGKPRRLDHIHVSALHDWTHTFEGHQIVDAHVADAQPEKYNTIEFQIKVI